jgi:ABC-type multidrug transport system fused ATPase/permease subunit
MDLEAWQVVVALSVPAFGFLGALARRERMPGLYRRLKHSTSALKDLPPEATDARSALENVVVGQAKAIAARESDKLVRKLNPYNVVFSIIISALLLLGAWPLLAWTTATWGQPMSWASVAVTSVYLLLAMTFSAAAFGTIFNPSSQRSPKATSVAK